MGIIHPHAPHHNKLRNHIHLPRHGDGGNIGHKQQILILKIQLGKRVRRKTAGKKLKAGNDNGQLRGIQHKLGKRNLRPDIKIILPSGIPGNPLNGENKHVLIQLQRRGHHPRKRNQHQNRQGDQNRVQDDTPKPIAFTLHFHLSPS